MTAPLCSHCLLPVSPRDHVTEVAGEPHRFCCYGCCLAFQVAHGEHEESDAAWLLIRLGTGAFLAMNIMLFSLLLYSGSFEGADGDIRPLVHGVLWLLATPAMVILGGPFLREAWQDGCRLRLGSSALLTLGTGAAYGYSTFAVVSGGPYVYFDTATMLLVLFTLGRYLEAAGRAKAMRSVAPMLAPERQWVTVLQDGTETCLMVRDVAAGSVILVRPGERIGVDGVVVEGASHVGEAILTGESRPAPKGSGAQVLAGSLNHEGPLLVCSQGRGDATRWMAIARSVRASLSRKGRAERLAGRIAGAFVPVVLGLAALTVLYWSQLVPFGEALLHGLAVLVVACPCGLGLAAPLATSIGIGRLAERGCLVRGGDVLESLAGLRRVAFDKTGTLTSGQPRLARIETDGRPGEEALRLAAGLEWRSEHPLAEGIREAARAWGISPGTTRAIRAVPGRGMIGEIDGETVAAGSASWLVAQGFVMPDGLAARADALDASGASLIHVGRSGRVIAVLALEDPLLPEARGVITAIHELGMTTALLSGDRAPAARRAADAAGISMVRSGLSPEDKRTVLEASGGAMAMVGDGLNDAPVLAAAPVGIAVGSAADLAREAADVVLPHGGLGLLPFVVTLSRATRRTVITSLTWAFSYNAVALALAMTGALAPVIAAALMAGSSLLVILNSLRLESVPARLARSAGAAGPVGGAVALRGHEMG